MEKKVLIDGKALPLSETKVTFLQKGSIAAPSPPFAKWMFRGVTILTTVIAFYIAGTSMVAEQWKMEIMLILKSIDLFTLGFSKMFGLVEDK